MLGLLPRSRKGRPSTDDLSQKIICFSGRSLCTDALSRFVQSCAWVPDRFDSDWVARKGRRLSYALLPFVLFFLFQLQYSCTHYCQPVLMIIFLFPAPWRWWSTRFVSATRGKRRLAMRSMPPIRLVFWASCCPPLALLPSCVSFDNP